MKFLLSAFFILSICKCVSQETEVPDFAAVDSLYREDQFYLAITYNILNRKNPDLAQNKFSAGLSGGFLRDMPLNKERTIAIAAGLGYTFNNYNYNLKISDVEPRYELIDVATDYDKNKLSLHFVELPIEFRWRTSTPESHKFWRVYTGVKLSYLLYSQSKYVGSDAGFLVTDNEDLNKFRYGVYLATGYNTWNFHMYYGLNPLFKSSAKLDGDTIDMRNLNIGLMFYIL